MKQKHIYNLAALLLASSAAFISCSDTDLDGPQTDGDRGASVVFNIKDIQQDNIAKVAAATRAGISPTLLYTPGLTQEDLAPRRLEAVSSDGLDACLIETTVEGVNPTIPDETTRGSVKAYINTDFSSFGYRGDTPTGISDTPNFFYNQRTKNNGNLYKPFQWAWSHRYARFYAVFPYSDGTGKIKFSDESHSGAPYVDFTVEDNVINQVDLLTACSGEVTYATQGTAPQTDLAFRHALTMVKFAVGSNLSWNKTITKVELKHACSEGRYTLSSQADGTGATWTNVRNPKDYTLSGLSISTSRNINTELINGNRTFLMIPQQLSGVQAIITFSDNTTITANLTGEWKAGTTKTYKISNTTSNWTYNLTVNPTIELAYNAPSGTYSITSFRQNGTVQQAVPWEIIGYDNNNDNTFAMDEKPDWLTSLSTLKGSGGTAAQTGTATVDNNNTMKDMLAERNQELKEAPAKGSAGDYYDLSTHDIEGNITAMNTANCYVISSAGHYKLPLIYGNAIKEGNTNESAYKTSHVGYWYLTNFQDHAGQNITSPYINIQNASNPATQASVLWADESGLIVNPTVVNDYLQFEVPEGAMKQGNVLIAAKNATGVVMWSWHLWFAPSDVLNTVAFTNDKGVFNFTKENLGWKYTKYEKTIYTVPRTVRVKVRQTTTNNNMKQEAIITITQNPGSAREGYNTLYEHARKDPLPGTNTVSEGNFYLNGNYDPTLSYTIQNPNRYTPYTPDDYYHYILCYVNLWSTDQLSFDRYTSVVKSVYDPCPVGFHVPNRLAFIDFSKTKVNTSNRADFNVSGDWDNGWEFNNKITSPDATLWFPITRVRNQPDGGLQFPQYGYYRTSELFRWFDNNVHREMHFAEQFSFGKEVVNAHYGGLSHGSYGAAVRPVADE